MSPSIFDKLTDPSQYTGTHKSRFDSHGNGLGLAGRDSVAKGGGYVGGVRASGAVVSLGQVLRPNLAGNGRLPSPSPNYLSHHAANRMSDDGSYHMPPAKYTPRSPSSVGRPNSHGMRTGGGSIFDKLTDSSQYTGAHKQRFDKNGNGRGMAGR